MFLLCFSLFFVLFLEGDEDAERFMLSKKLVCALAMFVFFNVRHVLFAARLKGARRFDLCEEREGGDSGTLETLYESMIRTRSKTKNSEQTNNTEKQANHEQAQNQREHQVLN